MNAELARQVAEAKARRARIDGVACRAIPADRIVEKSLPRRRPGKTLSPAREAIEREHQVRVACVKASYEAERATRRAMFAAAMEACREREIGDLGELEQYRRELLAEIGR